MLDLQSLSQHADAWLVQTPNRQQQLVLLRLDSSRARGSLAEVQKPPDLVANLR
jgi:hypothetical protein